MTKLAVSSLALALMMVSAVGMLEARVQNVQSNSKSCCERPPYH